MTKVWIFEEQKHKIIYDTKHAFYMDSLRKERELSPIAYIFDERRNQDELLNTV